MKNHHLPIEIDETNEVHLNFVNLINLGKEVLL